MGCGSSTVMVVEPVKDKNEHDASEMGVAGGGTRGDSAVSKHTTDSGLGMEASEGAILPGAVPRILPLLRAHSPGLAQESAERPRSSEILEQLLSQGIIPAQPRVGGSGEAYDIVMDDMEKPKRRPPPRLESLKIQREQVVTSKEDIEERMRQVEERRKVKEAELRKRLRTKSARPRGAAPVGEEESAPPELFQPDAPEPPPSPAARAPDLQVRDTRMRESSGGGAGGGALADSPELENDPTFQQTEDTDGIF